jgi:hypothetical protein
MKLSRFILLALILIMIVSVMHAADESKPVVDVVRATTRPSRVLTEDLSHLKPVIGETKCGVIAFIKGSGQVQLGDGVVFQPKVGPRSVGLRLVVKF